MAFRPSCWPTWSGRLARSVICNRPYNGIAAIDDYGAEHLESGGPILYTSQDSVLQLACHEAVMPASELYAACARVRECVRVAAGDRASVHRRPGAFERTLGRHDFALAPPARSYLGRSTDAGVSVHAVGKVGDLFAGVGIDAIPRCDPTRRRSRARRLDAAISRAASCSRT